MPNFSRKNRSALLGKKGLSKPSTKSRKPKPTAVLSAPVRNAVKNIVKGQEETRYAYGALPATAFNSGILSTSEWYNCIPDVQSGVAGYERSGLRITPTSLKLNWAISYNQITRSCDNYVVLYVFKMKRFKKYADMVASNMAGSFIDQAGGGLTAFSGYTQQIMTPVNNEQFILVAKKVIHLQKGIGALNNDTTLGYSGNGNKTAQMVSLNLKLPRLVYDEGDGVAEPNNVGLCWALGYAHTDSSNPDNAYSDINVSFTSQLYYKDS